MAVVEGVLRDKPLIRQDSLTKEFQADFSRETSKGNLSGVINFVQCCSGIFVLTQTPLLVNQFG
jgi:hypothetical protein